MFCAKCGTSLNSDVKFCAKCGAPIFNSAEVNSSQQASTAETGAIWNPNAASNWSLIFTPAFGAYLHALNWRTLGEPDRAQSAMVWFYFSLGMLFVYILMSLFMANENAAVGAARGLALLYLIYMKMKNNPILLKAFIVDDQLGS